MWLKSCIFLLNRQLSGMLLGLVSRRHTLHNAEVFMLMISDSTILKLATPMLNSCFYVFCVAYVSSSSYQPTDNLKKVNAALFGFLAFW